MIFPKNILLFTTFCCFFASIALGQVSVPTNMGKPVQILQSDSIMGIKQPDGSELRKLIGKVKLRQERTVIHCDLAIMNEITNVVEGYGHVKIFQGDSITTTSDTAIYYGATRQAKLNGRVSMNDKIMTLTTRKLDYDIANGQAYYTEKGKIVDTENTLTSKEGYYNTRSKEFLYKINVKLLGKSENKKPFTLLADSLRYNTRSKIAFFIAPTRISDDKSQMETNTGSYNAKTRYLYLTSRTTARNEEYDMVADTTYYDRNSQQGTLYGNAIMISKKDSTVLTGNYGYYDGKQGYSRLNGNALMRKRVGNDTLYVSADTLISIEKKETKLRKVTGFKHVLIYKRDMQGKCDSLVYNTADSTIAFYKKPILWNDNTQSEGDSIWVQMANNRVQQMYLKGKSFVISQDSLNEFNQLKGRKITALFNTDSKLDKVNVEGNGESVYYALDEKNKLTGMNRVQCSRIYVNFQKGRVKRIAFVGKPDAQFIPPKKIDEKNKSLEGFSWRIAERTTKEMVLKARK